MCDYFTRNIRTRYIFPSKSNWGLMVIEQQTLKNFTRATPDDEKQRHRLKGYVSASFELTVEIRDKRRPLQTRHRVNN